MDEVEARRDELFERKRAREYVAFVTGAVRRHKALMAVLFVSIVAASIAVILSLPKSYHAEAKVLAHANNALKVAGDTGSAEAPTRTAAETILRRDNLVSIIEQYDLVRHWQQHRSPAERARDTVMSWFSSRTDSEQDAVDGMVERLEKRLRVWTNDNGATVSIAIDWPDAQMASRIVDTAQQNYLESRHAQEITALAESIAILTTYASASKEDVDAAMSSVDKVKDEEPKAGTPPAHDTAPRVFAAPPRPPITVGDVLDPRVAQVQAKIEAKKRTLNDLEEFRHRRLADLQARLADDQTIYTENHPAVVDLKQAIASMSSESPQVKLLRSQITELEGERDALAHAHLGSAPSAAARSAPSTFFGEPSGGAGSDVARLDADLREERDPKMVYARGQLRDAMDKYSGLRAKIQAAQIDYDTAQAAFKYRYSVVTPAHVPKQPSKPNVAVDILAAIVGALFAAVVLAVVADLRSGRLVEPWQLERLLDKPILGEVEVPRLPPHGAT